MSEERVREAAGTAAVAEQGQRLKVSRTSWHYRWLVYCSRSLGYENADMKWGWFLFGFMALRQNFPGGHTGNVPKPKSLCGYFWTLVVGSLAWLALWLVSVFMLAVGGILTALVLVLALIVRAFRGRRHRKAHPSLVVAFVKAKKRRVCPLIEVVE